MDGLTGSLLVDVNSDSKTGVVLFKLELQSSSLDLRQRATVCFSDSGDSRGLSIYASSFASFLWWTWHITSVLQIPTNLTNQDILSFNIHVLLPQTSSTIDNFVTYLPLFSQSFGDFRKHGNFNQINIEGASQNISCQVGRWYSVDAWRWLLSVYLVYACLSDICEKYSCTTWRHLQCHGCFDPWHN